ncbi:MAG TPA: DUF2269 family protein [Longimicrobiales bacterium]
MSDWYNLFKFLHVVAAIVWVGGTIMLVVLTGRLARDRDGAVAGALSRHAALIGPKVLGPSAFLTLVAGIAMVAAMGWRMQLWLAWGLVGVFGSMTLGAVFQRRAGMRLAALSAASDPDPAGLRRARRHMALLNALNIALLLSTVWAMVFKPTI